jgi:hypothetical protein
VLDWLMPGLDSIGVLEHLRRASDKTLALTRTSATLDAITLGWTTFEKALASGDIQIAGDGKKFAELLSLLDTCQADFNIVTLCAVSTHRTVNDSGHKTEGSSDLEISPHRAYILLLAPRAAG